MPTYVIDEFVKASDDAKIDSALLAPTVRTADWDNGRYIQIINGDQSSASPVAGDVTLIDPADLHGTTVILTGTPKTNHAFVFSTLGGTDNYEDLVFFVQNSGDTAIAATDWHDSATGDAGAPIAGALALPRGNTVQITISIDSNQASGIAFAWEDITAPVSAPPTNLSVTRTSTLLNIASSTGTDIILGAPTSSLAGIMTAADKTTLDGLSSATPTSGGGGLHVVNMSVAQRYIRLISPGQSGNAPTETVTIDPATLDGGVLIVTGVPAVTSLLIADVQGGTDPYDGLQFILENQTDQDIEEYRGATGGGTGRQIDNFTTLVPGQRHLLTFRLDSTQTWGINLDVVDIKDGFVGLDAVTTMAADDTFVIADTSDQNRNQTITLADLRTLISGPSPATHTRRCAIRSAAGNFIGTDFTSATTSTSSTTHTLTTPTWDSGTRQMAFAIPNTEPDITALYFAGDTNFNAINGFPKASYTLTIGGVVHKLWVNSAVRNTSSGVSVQIEP